MRDAAEERILIQKAAEGDKDSFETLILSCKDKAYGIAFRYLKNEEDAMDALQESFIKIYKGLSSFNFESKFDTWVYRIVTNVCNDLYRKNKKKCLDMLADEHREVIILRDIKGFSYEEISEILDCSLGTVKSRISRARLRLKDIYLEGKNKKEF